MNKSNILLSLLESDSEFIIRSGDRLFQYDFISNKPVKLKYNDKEGWILYSKGKISDAFDLVININYLIDPELTQSLLDSNIKDVDATIKYSTTIRLPILEWEEPEDRIRNSMFAEYKPDGIQELIFNNHTIDISEELAINELLTGHLMHECSNQVIEYLEKLVYITDEGKRIPSKVSIKMKDYWDTSDNKMKFKFRKTFITVGFPENPNIISL